MKKWCGCESLSASGSCLPGATGAVGTAEASPLSFWGGVGWGVGAGRSGGRLLCRIGVFGCGVRCVAAGTAADSLRASGFVPRRLCESDPGAGARPAVRPLDVLAGKHAVWRRRRQPPTQPAATARRSGNTTVSALTERPCVPPWHAPPRPRCPRPPPCPRSAGGLAGQADGRRGQNAYLRARGQLSHVEADAQQGARPVPAQGHR